MASSNSRSTTEGRAVHSQYEALELVYSEGLNVRGHRLAGNGPPRAYEGVWEVSRTSFALEGRVGSGRDLMEAVRDLLAQERGELGRSARSVSRPGGGADPEGDALM